MALTRQQLRQYVREYFDLDITELPDSLVDIFLNDGFNRIVRASWRWPFLEFTDTVTTEAGTGEYTIPSSIHEVEGIQGPDFNLQWVSPQTAEQTWWSANETQSKPYKVSFWGGKLRLWPKPDSAYTITIRGYKKPTWAADAGAIPTPLPDDFHELIGTWAVSRAAAQQDDPSGAQLHAASFQDGIQELKRYYNNTPGPGPIVLNSQRMSTELPSRLRYPWEA